MAKADVNDPVTRGMLNEAVEAVLKGVDQLMNGLRGEMITRFKKVDDRLYNLEVELSSVKDSVKGLKADLSDTPSRREFERLKTRVDKYHPLA